MATWWLSGRCRSTHQRPRCGALRAWRKLRIEPLEARLLLTTSPGFDYDQVNAAWFGALGSGTQATNGQSEWVLRLTPEAAEQAAGVSGAPALLSALPITVMRGLGLTGQLLVESNLDPAALTAALSNSSFIASFQINASIHGSAEPNDPRFTVRDQYALNNIGQNEGTNDADIDTIEAWDVTTGSSSVVTAVIDSGIDLTHPDLAANLWTNPGEIAGDNLDNDNNGYIDDVNGWDFVNNDKLPLDDHGHGTHVAGIIGARGNNNLGIAGVNWNASLMALKFLDENNVGSVADAAEAINYATMMRTRVTNPVNIRVINASWGGSGVNSDVLRMAIEASAAADILFVAAAGNGDVFGRGQNIEAVPFFPASFTTANIISVAATDRNDQLAAFSNFGATSVDIAAPGVSIWSTDLPVNIPTDGDGFTNTRSGTSMAAPYVAGVASLIWSASPTATVAEVRQAILAGGDPLANLQGKVSSGRRLNANGALVNLPPQAIVTAANITAVGATSYPFSATFTSNGIANPLDYTTITDGDFRVVRRGTTDYISVIRTSPAPTVNANSITATYQFTPPGGSWDALDIGTYDIELVAGEVRDTTGHSSVQKVVKSFTVDLSAAGIFRPTVFTDGGVGSLRDAIQQANALDPLIFPNGGTIILSPGTYTLSLAGAGEDANAAGDLDVTGRVTIAGSGVVVIDANGVDRVFDVRAGGNLTLNGLTITGGNVAGDGGGIRNAGVLTVDRSTIDGNSSIAAATPVEAGSGEFRINVTTGGIQSQPSIDMNPSGQVVFSWTTQQATEDVMALLLDGSGNLSNEITVWNGGAADRNPDITIADTGSFVVAYESFGVDASGYGIDAIRFDSAGNALNVPNQRIGIPNIGAPGDQLEPLLIGLGDDSFIATWFDNAGNDGSGWGVHGRRFDQNGSPVGNQFTVSTTTANDQQSITGADIDSNGFVLAWNGNGVGDSLGSYARLFNSNGIAVGPEFRLHEATAGVQQTPRAVLLGDRVAFIWVVEGTAAEQGTYLRFFDRAGTALGGEIRLSTLNPAEPDTRVRIPDIARVSDDRFVIVSEEPAGDGDGLAIKLQLYSSNGVAVGTALTVNTTVAGDQSRPAVASDGDGKVVVTWQGNGVGDDSGIFARTFIVHPEANGGGIHNLGVLTIKESTISANMSGGEGGGIYNAGTLNATNATISGNDAANQGGGVYNATGASATIGSSTVTENSSPRDLPLLTPSGAEFRVNQGTPGTHERVDVDVNSSGRAVVTWTQNFGGTESDVFARVLDGLVTTAGNAEFQVNPSHTAEILDSDVGVSDSGKYLIGYMGWGLENPYGVRVVSYSVAGAASSAVSPSSSGGHVNTSPIIKPLSGGGYVVGWWDEGARDGSGASYIASIFDENGNRIVNDFSANQSTSGNQYPSEVAQLPDGSILFVWWGDGSGGTAADVYGRRFNSSGVALGGEFRINSSVSGDQEGGSIAVGATGVVVTWGDRGRGRITGQRLDFSGTKVGAEFDIAVITPTDSGNNDVVILPDGSFVVVWSAVNPANGTTDVFAREYSADGTSLGATYVVNDYTTGTQWNPRIDRDAAGNTLIVWQGEGSGDGSGIFAKRFTTPANAGGIFGATGSSATIKNSIVAGNGGATGIADVFGVYSSTGGNLIGNVGAASGFTQPTDQTNVSNPLLAPLADNGGPTKTHLPLPGSPAIDKAVAGSPATDQRGVARSADGDNNGVAAADIGAVERYHASITGRKFNDLDQDGVQDSGELGIANWTLYLDLNTNNQLDAGEPTAVTNAQGDYTFKQLTPGTYTVAEVNQTGWTRTNVKTAYLNHVRNNQPDTLSNTVTGLSIVHELALSPNGEHAYAINSSNSLPDSIVSFRRNETTGALEFIAAITNDGSNTLGLEGEGHMVVSPDGKHVYTVGSTSNAVSIFARNLSTGALTFVAKVVDGDEIEGELVEGMTDPRDLVISPDNNHIYIVTATSVVPMRRNTTTGLLTVLPIRPGGGTAISISPNGEHVYAASATALKTYTRTAATGLLNAGTTFAQGQPAPGGGIADALQDVADIILGPTGSHLYTLSRTDESIGVYSRNATSGALKYETKLARDSSVEPDGLAGAKSLAISSTGDRLYATADGDDSVAVFARSTTDGSLTFLQLLSEFGTDGQGVLIETLSNVDGVVVAPNGNIYVAAREGAITQFKRDNAGLDRQTLLVGQDLTGVNFSSYAAPGEIRGTVFGDLNNNGLRDATEEGLPGRTVYLDADGSNTLNNAELSTTTGPLGDYTFANLAAPGTYTVRLALPGTESITSPPAQNGQEWTLDVLPNQVRVGADFLVFSSLSGVGSSSVSGLVFQDTNNDGVRQTDGTEPTLSGRRVYLDINDNGQFDPEELSKSVLTLADGLYSITGLGAAKHVVRIVGAVSGERTSTPAGNTFANTSLTTGTNPVNVIAADLNGDTKPDLVSLDAGASQVSVRMQQANGSYGVWQTYAVTEAPTGLAVGKFNNDALPDIAITSDSGKLMFLLGAAGGGFNSTLATPLAIPLGLTTLVAANFNNDAYDDLAIAIDGVPDALRILLNSGTATPSFTALPDFNLAQAGPLAIAAGKIDSDNFIDLVVANFDADSVQVFRNVGGTSFVAQTAITTNVGDGPSSVVIADLNGDGHNDIVGASLGTNSVFRLLGNGTITPTTTALPIPVNQGPRTVSVEDIDGDGDRDLIVGNALANDVVVVRNLGVLGFSFPESSGVASFASLVASGVKQVLATDLNGDGVTDVAAVRGDASSGSLLVLNNAFGLGSHRVELNGTNFASGRNFGLRASLVGDYDRNGAINQTDREFWATHFGATSGIGLQADGNNDGVVDAADFTVWRDRLPASAAAPVSNSVATMSTAPSATSIWLSPVVTLSANVTPSSAPETDGDDGELIDLLLASLAAGDQVSDAAEPFQMTADDDQERDEFFQELGDDSTLIDLFQLTSAL